MSRHLAFFAEAWDFAKPMISVRSTELLPCQAAICAVNTRAGTFVYEHMFEQDHYPTPQRGSDWVQSRHSATKFKTVALTQPPIRASAVWE